MEHTSKNNFSSICRASRSTASASNSPARFISTRRLPCACSQSTAINSGVIRLGAPACCRACLRQMQGDPEEFAHLAVEVGDVGLRTADHTDPDVALSGKVVGEQAHGGGFAAAGH